MDDLFQRIARVMEDDVADDIRRAKRGSEGGVMVDDEDNYHHCGICGIAPCDCGESQETSECAGCSFCDIEGEEEGAAASHTPTEDRP